MSVRFTAAVVVSLASVGACRVINADPAARGRQIVERMSTTLASAQSLSVTTHEVRDRVKADGSIQHVNAVRQTVVRRPDRLYFRSTGDVNNEGWYDGVGLTLALHNEKVFAQARMPESLDRALDAIHERYDVPMPLADFVYSSPAKALLTDSTTGGWVGQEDIDGRATDHVSFKDKGVEWEVWVPTAGSALPLRAVLRFPKSKRLRAVAMTFSDWSLAPEIAADRFTPHVEEDYEGIAMIQRATILRHAAEATPSTDASRK
jgi:hypothetical protein